MQHQKFQNNHDYKCCLCRYFQLEGVRWGHCEILNVTVKGNCPACGISQPFFDNSQKLGELREADEA